MSGKIGPKIVLDGEKEYVQALKNITQQQKTLQAELKSTQSSYDSHTTAQKKNADAAAALEKRIDLQKQKIQKLQELVDKSTKAYGASDTKTQKYRQSLAEATTELNRMKSGQEGVNAAAGSNIQTMGQLVSSLGLATIAVGALKTAYDDLTETMEHIDNIGTTSEQSGFSTDTLQKWEYAAEMIDVSSETIISAARKMKKNMSGNSDYFEELGVAVTDASGNMRDAEAVFNDTIAALSKIPNETERDQAAMKIFGKSADDLAGVIDDGGARLTQYGQRAEELGLILSGDTIDKMNNMKDTVDEAGAAWDAAKTKLDVSILSAWAPIIKEIAGGMTELAGVIGNIPAPLVALGSGALAAAAGFVAINKAVTTLNAAKALTTALPAIAASLSGTATASTASAAGITAVGVSSAGASGGVSTLSTAMATLSAGAEGFIGLGAGLLMAGGGVLAIATAGEKLASAGGGAIATTAGLAVGVAALAAGAAVAGPALTAGAVGIVAFGAGVALVGVGIGAATAGIGVMGKSLPEIAEFGGRAAQGLTQIGAAAGTIGAGAVGMAEGLAAAIIPITAMAALTAADAAAVDLLGKSFAAANPQVERFAEALASVAAASSSIKGVFGGCKETGGVKWHAKAMNHGMILRDATIFGMQDGSFLGGGEAGTEVVVGANSLSTMIGTSVRNALAGMRSNYTYGGNVINVYGARGQSEAELADIVSDRINYLVERKLASKR